MCRKTEERSTFRAILSQINLRLASIAVVVVGYTLAAMEGVLLGVVVVVFTVWIAGRLLGAFGEAGHAIMGRRVSNARW